MSPELISPEWHELVKDEYSKDYFIKLKEGLRREYTNQRCFPAPSLIFNAFKLTPPNKVRVVFLTQDPYPNENAHGLCYSSLLKDTPYSLQRVFREVDRDIVKTNNYEEFKQAFPNNDLTPWAKKGILLLNSCLSVRAGEPGSHSSLGWQQFVSRVLEIIWTDNKPKVFIGMGSEACKLLIPFRTRPEQHLIIETGHPASGAHGKDKFSGAMFASKTNYYFMRNNQEQINWTLNEN